MGALIFIILLILAGVFFKYISPNMHHYKLKIIVSVYVCILLISVIVSYQIPKASFSELKVVSKGEIENAEKLEAVFYDFAHKGQLDKVEGVVVNGPLSLEYTGKQINIQALKNFTPSILAKRKNTDDGKIEVVFYSTRSIIDGVDFTDKIKPTKVFIEGKNLLFKSENNKFDFVRFTQDFPAAQFQGEGIQWELLNPRNFWRQQIVYLHIPKSLKVKSNSENLNIEFIKDNK